MTAALANICVYCGAHTGRDPGYAATAALLGRTLAERGLGVVYGGGRVGLMGVVADAALAAGGRVTGIIPQALMTKELAHSGLTELVVTASMHERKAQMAERADAFIALPGGLGTFEELFEIWTWGQLGWHRKPCGVVNVAGFYDGLIAFLDHATDAGFVRTLHRGMLLVDDDPARLLARFAQYEAPAVTEWVDRAQT